MLCKRTKPLYTVPALHQVSGGKKVTGVCRRLVVREQTFHRWKKQFTGLGCRIARTAATRS